MFEICIANCDVFFNITWNINLCENVIFQIKQIFEHNNDLTKDVQGLVYKYSVPQH